VHVPSGTALRQNECKARTALLPAAYLQGANYIPSHIVHTNVSSQMLNDTLQYALESNMNM
jgi:hypothetical protein